jgi:tetratricopeptide (TPR) repeat protein
MDDLPGAKEKLERALVIDEKALGKDHPSVAIDLSNLGLVLLELKDKDNAKKNFRRAYDIFLLKLGPNHSNTITAKKWLDKVS